MEIDKENLKSETKETVNQVKDTIKNVDINKEAKETKGFVANMFSAPFAKVEGIANEEEDAFKKAVVLLLLHTILAFVVSIFGYHFGNILSKLWDVVMDTVAPIVAILVPSILILIMNKSNKKPLTTIIATLVVAKIPTIISAALTVIRSILPRVSLIISPISSGLSAISTVLAFYGMMKLFDEDNDKFVAKYVLIQIITALVLYVI